MNHVEADSNFVVKVVTNSVGKVLYMSRSLVPVCKGNTTHNQYKRHLSVIGYRLALNKYVDLDIGVSEIHEDIELRRVREELRYTHQNFQQKAFQLTQG